MKKVWLVFIILIFSQSYAAVTINDIKDNLLQQKNEIHNYQADIINTISGSLVEPKTSTGKIYFIAPNTMRTDIYGKTPQSSLVKDGKSWSIDYQGNVTEIISDSSLIDHKFSDPLVLFEKFDFSIQSIDATTIKLIGIPKSSSAKDLFSGSHFSKIVLYIDSTAKTLREVRVHNSQGQEIVRIQSVYQQVNDLSFLSSTEISLNIGSNKLQVKTLYQNIQLNQQIPTKNFDLAFIKQELRGMSGLKND